jgi:Domain of unknown function (DUF4383)
MPVTAGHVPGLTSRLRRVPMDPRRFRSGRWLLLIEGVLVSAFAVAGLVSAALHPYADPTGTPVLGLATTPAHSAVLLGLGVVAVASVGKRRAAVAVTALSAVVYTMLLFFSSVATARGMPTPLGLHAADILLHGVLAVVNLALLMWLIPDELGDEPWLRRRGRGRDRVRRQGSAAEAGSAGMSASKLSPTQLESPPPTAADAQESGGPDSPAQHAVVRGQPSQPVSVGAASHGSLEQPGSRDADARGAENVAISTQLKHLAARGANAALSRSWAVAVAVLGAVVGVIIWIRRRRSRELRVGGR